MHAMSIAVTIMGAPPEVEDRTEPDTTTRASFWAKRTGTGEKHSHVGFALEQHRRVRMRGHDLGKNARSVLQIGAFREEGHAARVLPWYCLKIVGMRVISEDGDQEGRRTFSNVYPGTERMPSLK